MGRPGSSEAEYNYEQYSVKMFENPWEYLLTAEQEEAFFQQITKNKSDTEVGMASTEGVPNDDSKINIDFDDGSKINIDSDDEEEIVEQETPVKDPSISTEQVLCTESQEIESQDTESQGMESQTT